MKTNLLTRTLVGGTLSLAAVTGLATLALPMTTFAQTVDEPYGGNIVINRGVESYIAGDIIHYRDIDGFWHEINTAENDATSYQIGDTLWYRDIDGVWHQTGLYVDDSERTSDFVWYRDIDGVWHHAIRDNETVRSDIENNNVDYYVRDLNGFFRPITADAHGRLSYQIGDITYYINPV